MISARTLLDTSLFLSVQDKLVSALLFIPFFSKHKQNKAGIVVGSVIGAALIVLLIVLAVLKCKQSKYVPNADVPMQATNV